MEPYAGADYNLTLCPIVHCHSRVDYNTFTTGNPMPESTLSPSQGFGFGLRIGKRLKIPATVVSLIKTIIRTTKRVLFITYLISSFSRISLGLPLVPNAKKLHRWEEVIISK
jgi:hypothetical protein